jgi:hypothetical protein
MKTTPTTAWKVLAFALFALLLISARATELISNGGFETLPLGTGWTLSGAIASNNGGFARAGTYFLWFGGAVSFSDSGYQDVSIPSSATAATLTFYYNINSQEGVSVANDTFTVTIRNTSGTVLATVANLSNKDQTSPGSCCYTLKTFNLLAYAGQTIRIYFTSANNATLVTNFRVDDVSVQVTVPTVSIPTVQTLDATLVGTTSATLNGQVVSDGGSTILERRIEWATSTGNWGTGTSGVDYGFFSDATTTFNISGNNFSLSLIGFAANTGYKYRVWARNSVGWSDVNSVNVKTFNTAAATIYAITTTSSPTAGGSTSGGGNYSSGQSVTVTASANSGYNFANWTEGASIVSSSAS